MELWRRRGRRKKKIKKKLDTVLETEVGERPTFFIKAHTFCKRIFTLMDILRCLEYFLFLDKIKRIHGTTTNKGGKKEMIHFIFQEFIRFGGFCLLYTIWSEVVEKWKKEIEYSIYGIWNKIKGLSFSSSMK